MSTNIIAAATRVANDARPVPTKITIQFVDPGARTGPPQVRIARHYGRGRRIEYTYLTRRPAGVDHREQWCAVVAQNIRESWWDLAPELIVEVLPESTY